MLVAGAAPPDFDGLVVEDEPASEEPEDVDDDSELEDFSALTLAEPLPDSRLSVR